MGKRFGPSQGSGPVLFRDRAPLRHQTKKTHKTLHSANAVFQCAGTRRQNCPLSSAFLPPGHVGRLDGPHPQPTRAKASLPWEGMLSRPCICYPCEFSGVRERGSCRRCLGRHLLASRGTTSQERQGEPRQVVLELGVGWGPNMLLRRGGAHRPFRGSRERPGPLPGSTTRTEGVGREVWTAGRPAPRPPAHIQQSHGCLCCEGTPVTGKKAGILGGRLDARLGGGFEIE